jgi:ureidoglycolate lyase
MQIAATPLTSTRFAPYGIVIPAMTAKGRAYYNDGLESSREGARFNLSVARLDPYGERVLRATVMERHEFSSQTLLPLSVARYLVVVAPSDASGGPDTERAEAFIASGRQGVTYRRNTWHHGVIVLDAPAEFAVLMWCDGTNGDEEFRTLDRPFTVAIGQEVPL